MAEQQLAAMEMSILGSGLCIADKDYAQGLGYSDAGIDASVLAPMLRRRTSIATKIAITALERARCGARVERDLPVVFSSTVGEMAVTDRLCSAIAADQFPLSPTMFHNSVHNTAAGYWSLSTSSMAPMQAMAGLEDNFAMGLLEAACQLKAGVERILLVVYDEAMPERLLPEYSWKAFSTAWVLGPAEENQIQLSLPYRTQPDDAEQIPFSQVNPAEQGMELYNYIHKQKTGRSSVKISMQKTPWWIDVVR